MISAPAGSGKTTLVTSWLHACGQREAAWNTLAAAREVVEQSKSPRRWRLVAVVTAELQLREGNVVAAARTLSDTGAGADSAAEYERLTYARLLLAQHEFALVENLLDRLEEAARKDGQVGSLIAIHVLQALCQRALGNRPIALERLAHAVSLAASNGYRRVFLDEGPTVAALLGQVRHAAPAFVTDLLEAFPRAQDAPLPADSLPEPLSKTQIEILHLVNLGLTNEEIANKLAIALGTTKWHLSQIFGKLHVRNRTEAVTKARQLKLL